MIELLLEAERALSFGRLERAEQLYRQVAAADSRNSIAVVGLARVALERADDLGAYLLARRALIIDPENEAARRLAVRLEEVMRTRGDPVPDTPAVRDASAVADPGVAAEATEAAVPAVPDPDLVDPGQAATRVTQTARTPRRSLLDRLRRRC